MFARGHGLAPTQRSLTRDRPHCLVQTTEFLDLDLRAIKAAQRLDQDSHATGRRQVSVENSFEAFKRAVGDNDLIAVVKLGELGEARNFADATLNRENQIVGDGEWFV